MDRENRKIVWGIDQSKKRSTTTNWCFEKTKWPTDEFDRERFEAANGKKST